MARAVKLLLLLLGLCLAGFLVREHSAALADSLRRVGWGFLPFFSASFLVYALDTWGWRLVFLPGQAPVGFSRLFSVRMAGEAVNKITPLASMGGEPLKGYLLARDGTLLTGALASVAIAKNVMTLAQIAFIFGGVALAARALPGRLLFLLGFTLFPGLVLAAILVTAAVDLRLRRKRRPEPTPEPAPPRKGRAALELWAQVADFYWAHPRAFALSFLLFFLGWAAGALELLAGAAALGFALSMSDALALEALLCSVNMATFFIPANAGSQEGGFAFLAPLLGVAGPHGLALAVLRRCRDVLWVGFGVLYLAATEGRVLFRPVEAQGITPAQG